MRSRADANHGRHVIHRVAFIPEVRNRRRRTPSTRPTGGAYGSPRRVVCVTPRLACPLGARYSAYRLCCRRSSLVTRQTVAALPRRTSKRRFCSFLKMWRKHLAMITPFVGQVVARTSGCPRTGKSSPLDLPLEPIGHDTSIPTPVEDGVSRPRVGVHFQNRNRDG